MSQIITLTNQPATKVMPVYLLLLHMVNDILSVKSEQRTICNGPHFQTEMTIKDIISGDWFASWLGLFLPWNPMLQSIRQTRVDKACIIAYYNRHWFAAVISCWNWNRRANCSLSAKSFSGNVKLNRFLKKLLSSLIILKSNGSISFV